MVHGYHVICGAYGFWLPNDPRGSWSDFIGAWELWRFGPATKGLERKFDLSPNEQRMLDEARRALKYPAVEFTGVQARAIGRGFAKAVASSQFTIWACSILPCHVHLIIARIGTQWGSLAVALPAGQSQSELANCDGERATTWTVLAQDNARRRGLPVTFALCGECIAADPSASRLSDPQRGLR